MRHLAESLRRRKTFVVRPAAENDLPTKKTRLTVSERSGRETLMKLLIVDAFADRPFTGNPAAVCLLEKEQDATCMQAVAAEMNLSETAFVRPLDNDFELRWFTPTIEVDLCGHATLATAHTLWTEGIIAGDSPIRFHTRSGVLTCQKHNPWIELNFPATPVEESQPPEGLLQSLGVLPIFVGKSKFDNFVHVESEEIVRSLKPDFAKLLQIPMRGVIVTSRSDDSQFDFVSRFFAPAAGIDEDPVTGSAHCCLGPFWSEQLGKTEMKAFQASARGGILQVQVAGDRVVLGGKAVTVLRGELG
ncbi:MAG: PhzF family phenazine biosynthesis protein [Planctomycetaceae bacterium]